MFILKEEGTLLSILSTYLNTGLTGYFRAIQCVDMCTSVSGNSSRTTE
jgi:hypothetical protein